MQFSELPTALQAVTLVIGAFVAWFALRFALRVTVRLFAVGCLAIAALVLLGGLAGWIG